MHTRIADLGRVNCSHPFQRFGGPAPIGRPSGSQRCASRTPGEDLAVELLVGEVNIAVEVDQGIVVRWWPRYITRPMVSFSSGTSVGPQMDTAGSMSAGSERVMSWCGRSEDVTEINSWVRCQMSWRGSWRE